MGNINEMAGVGIHIEHAKAFIGSKNLAVTAAGSSSQANSTELTAAVNVVTTGGANTGVKPSANIPVDSEMRIYNAVGNAILVYPPSGGEINGLGADAAATLAQDKGMLLTRLSATQWGAVYA
jgi:hypothetical protein